MKNQTKRRIDVNSANPVELNVTLRIRPERWEEFTRLCHNLSIMPDQLVSSMVDGDMEGDVSNPLAEVGYGHTSNICNLYPEHAARLMPLRDAFADALNASWVLSDVRRKVGAL